MRLDGKLDPARIGAPGAAVGDTLVWDGFRFVPQAAGGDSDHAGTGLQSTAVGATSVASASSATSLGYNARALATNSTALGKSAYIDPTTGGTGTAVGYQSLVTGSNGLAVGASSSATAASGTTVGASASATADSTTSLGYGAAASASYATGVGTLSVANGSRAVALGAVASCYATDGIVIGSDSGSSALYPRSTVIGTDHAANASDRCCIKNDDLELVRSSAGTGTSIILADSSTGTRYRISIVGGVLTTALA